MHSLRWGGGHIIWAHWVICLYLKLHCAVFFSNRPCQITFKHQACICHLIILSMHSWQPWSLVHYSGSAHTLDEACRSITTMHYHFICAVYAAAHLKYLQILSRIYVYTMYICIRYVYMYTLWAGLQTAFDDFMPVQQSSSCCCFLIMCCHVLWCTVKQQKQNEAVLIGWIIRNGQCHAWGWPSYDTEDWSNDE